MSSSLPDKRAYLLSGEPGSGKTTAIKQVLSRAGRRAGGFYTEEIRDRGVRQGFRIVTLDGRQATLAHRDIRGPYAVSKYGVDVAAMDALAVPAVREATAGCDIVVIDEIGKMELFSSSFRDAVIEALDSGRKVLGTIMLASHPWADTVKHRADVQVVSVTRAGHGQVVEEVLRWLES